MYLLQPRAGSMSGRTRVRVPDAGVDHSGETATTVTMASGQQTDTASTGFVDGTPDAVEETVVR